MRRLALALLLGCLLLVAPVAAEDNSSDGILEAIIDFFFGWLSGEDEPAGTGSTLSEEEEITIPGTNITAVPTVEPTTTPGENVTATPTPAPTPRTLGTVYAVDYKTSPPYGSAPFMVRFTAVNESDVEYTHWQFGDGYSSTERDHWHTYTAAGTYTATLTVGNATWNQTAEIAITVEPPGVVPLPTDAEMML